MMLSRIKEQIFEQKWTNAKQKLFLGIASMNKKNLFFWTGQHTTMPLMMMMMMAMTVGLLDLWTKQGFRPPLFLGKYLHMTVFQQENDTKTKSEFHWQERIMYLSPDYSIQKLSRFSMMNLYLYIFPAHTGFNSIEIFRGILRQTLCGKT